MTIGILVSFDVLKNSCMLKIACDSELAFFGKRDWLYTAIAVPGRKIIVRSAMAFMASLSRFVDSMIVFDCLAISEDVSARS